MISLQDDDGFERTSVYRFNTSWNFVGPQRFSKGRTYFSSLHINERNVPYVLYEDASYNKQGTVMRYNKNNNKWDTIGARGFLPFAQTLQRHCMFFNLSGKPYVAFSDKNNGGRVSVVKYDNNTLLSEDQSSGNNVIVSNASGIDLYPNPAHNYIVVNLSSKEANTQLEVFDISGKKVIEKTLNNVNGGSNVNVDISQLASGTYLLGIKTNTGFYSRKFIKN
jgi:hypothetical protein